MPRPLQVSVSEGIENLVTDQTFLDKFRPGDCLPNLILVAKVSLPRKRAMESIPEVLIAERVFTP